MPASRGIGDTPLHPVRPVLLADPLALFSSGLLLDIAYLKSATIPWSNFSAWLMVGGCIFGGLMLAWPIVVSVSPGRTTRVGALSDGSRLRVGIGSNRNAGERGLDGEEKRAVVWEIDRLTGFGGDFRDGVLVGEHGSWNRRDLSGDKVVRIPFPGGRSGGKPVDFVAGLLDGQKARGRALGVAFYLAKRILLIADDVSNTAWRIAPAK